MKEILIVSGKGGTGKTSLSACFARLSSNCVFCDCDVDASNLYLLLSPEIQEVHEFFAGLVPLIDLQKCSSCGKCQELCRFQAIAMTDNGPHRGEGVCEGCGVCADNCPEHAIEMHPRHCGRYYRSKTAYGQLFHAELFPGEENSGKLIAELRQAARAGAEQEKVDYLISDGPPGIGCPVISSMSGVDLVLAVTEPTPSGIHDLKRVVELAHQFEIPVRVIINKWDLNPALSGEIAEFCSKNDFAEIGRIPYDPIFSELLRKGRTVLSAPDSAPAIEIKKIWQKIKTLTI